MTKTKRNTVKPDTKVHRSSRHMLELILDMVQDKSAPHSNNSNICLVPLDKKKLNELTASLNSKTNEDTVRIALSVLNTIVSQYNAGYKSIAFKTDIKSLEIDIARLLQK